MFKRFNLFTIVISLFFCGCIALQRKSVDDSLNPMTDLWSETRNKILNLERSNASEIEWAALADSSDIIEDKKELSRILSSVSISEQRRKACLYLFDGHYKAIHFGFDSNYHALVFFKGDKSILVEKW